MSPVVACGLRLYIHIDACVSGEGIGRKPVSLQGLPVGTPVLIVFCCSVIFRAARIYEDLIFSSGLNSPRNLSLAVHAAGFVYKISSQLVVAPVSCRGFYSLLGAPF